MDCSRCQSSVPDVAHYCHRCGQDLVPTQERAKRRYALAPNEPGLRWLGLNVKAHVQQDESHATVAFVARSKLGGRAHRLTETSRFVREDGRWFYLDGDLA